jgi:NitT/TauT family transport system substrate-binding protein
LNRRRLLAGLPALLAGLHSGLALAEPPPEVTRVRLSPTPKVSDCFTPIFVSEELLRAEGFSDIQFEVMGTSPDWQNWLADGDLDFDFLFAPETVRWITNGKRVKALSGLHAGCLELIANRSFGSVKERSHPS